jgi:predicted branched-subunit amino acid permease
MTRVAVGEGPLGRFSRHAGSLKFLLVGLAVAATPLAQVAATTLIVNLRHVFYALSFPLDRVDGVLAKVYSTYALTDEAYTATSAEPSKLDVALDRVGAVHLSGGLSVRRHDRALVGSAMPIERVQGLDFALTALFVVLSIDAYRPARTGCRRRAR